MTQYTLRKVCKKGPIVLCWCEGIFYWLFKGILHLLYNVDYTLHCVVFQQMEKLLVIFCQDIIHCSVDWFALQCLFLKWLIRVICLGIGINWLCFRMSRCLRVMQEQLANVILVLNSALLTSMQYKLTFSEKCQFVVILCFFNLNFKARLVIMSVWPALCRINTIL